MRAEPTVNSSIRTSSQAGTVRPLAPSIVPKSVVRYAYYAFIFSLPFEMAEVTFGGLFLSRLFGLVFLAATLCQPRLFLKPPPNVFWFFAIYVCLNGILGAVTILDNPNGDAMKSEIITQLFTLCQLLVFFWLSYNLMLFQRVIKETFLALAISCIVLAVLQIVGVVSSEFIGERVSAFGGNPSALAQVISVGFLALVGLAYGSKDVNTKIRLLAWLSSALLLICIVRTGSRGDVIAIVLALFVVTLKPKSMRETLKLGLIAAVMISCMVWVSFNVDFVRERWEKTFYEGDTSGRDEILQAAWEMYLERPVIGWGPVNHYYELGPRVGWYKRDPHNLYLWLLLETGLAGALPFVIGLWFCWCSAWKARAGIQGTLPLLLLFFFLLTGLNGTSLSHKLFWLVLSYALASGSHVVASPGIRLKALRVAAERAP